MSLIEWSDSLVLGIPRFDAQHRGLVALLNRIHEEIRRGGSEPELEAIVDELSGYAARHFREEEWYFREYNLPSSEDHEREHAEFDDYVERCRLRLRAGDRVTAAELVYFLATWIARHIGQEDRKLIRVAALIRGSPRQAPEATGSR